MTMFLVVWIHAFPPFKWAMVISTQVPAAVCQTFADNINSRHDGSSAMCEEKK